MGFGGENCGSGRGWAFAGDGSGGFRVCYGGRGRFGTFLGVGEVLRLDLGRFKLDGCWRILFVVVIVSVGSRDVFADRNN